MGRAMGMHEPYERDRAKALKSTSAHAERRRSCRVVVDGKATMWKNAELRGRYRVLDLSIGGCQLIGGPPRPVGEELDILLHLAHRTPLLMRGQVLRTDDAGIAISFATPSPTAEDMIQELVFDALVHSKAPSRELVLVLEQDKERSASIVRALTALGLRSVVVSTALDAVQLLMEESHRIRLAFIDVNVAAAPCFEMIEFLAQNHPNVRRVLMGNLGTMGEAVNAHAAGDVDALLEPPVKPETLRRLLVSLGCPPHDADLCRTNLT